MEVSSSMPQPDQNGAHSNVNAMDASMDIDMDIDLGPLPEPELIETEPAIATTTADGATDPSTAETQPEKVHIRGVDDLTTDNIKQFAIDNFPLETPTRIEWIDDTSANIIYSSPEIGLQALAALTQPSEEEDTSALPALRLRTAKALSTHPESVLQVRLAVKSDRKKPRAYEASRFYLMHPEHDPREKLRLELADRRRQGGGDSSDGDYRRRRFDGHELRRRRDRDADENFGANMYDDEGPTATTSYSDADKPRGERRRRGQRELFPEEGSSGRLRNRSASPGRDTLAESGQLDNEERDNRRRFRERSPKLNRRNKSIELFPSHADKGDSSTRELFPNRPTSSYIKKELFPSKVSNHRRSDAIDAADETADLFSQRISVPLVDGARDQSSSHRNTNVELFPESRGRSGVSIRGAAGQDQGISIRGSANGLSIKGRGASVRELFPSKFNNNAGKELFSDKIEGRGGPRRRAEDMFS
ncbi:NCBP3 domain-containing protein [Aspergillus clavatus NRRL 1]|uniref:Uncharacterized protein n=1 Tax=Aspergillus clavatus (strain ATCC 1007 / CBS 513.65 / DSM 816 / NCTC 3887 / NRRL 1 / QM 1276 / 107) TaxID=344612 RepID=A1CRX3_ASPCL|nr:uncharacterized protein ACLA_031270 [Aspergillus clavatus NRRL 1]EAW08394.1 conserved hypothetical protein [Aspergillus clavatus NRRL 1]